MSAQPEPEYAGWEPSGDGSVCRFVVINDAGNSVEIEGDDGAVRVEVQRIERIRPGGVDVEAHLVVRAADAWLSPAQAGQLAVALVVLAEHLADEIRGGPDDADLE